MRGVALGLALLCALAMSGASLAQPAGSNLYTGDLASGAATMIGPIGGGSEVIGLAAAGDDLIYGVTTESRLVALTAATPGSLRLNRQLSGLAPGIEIVGINLRPAAGELYGVGDDSVLYIIDPATGATTAVVAPASTR